MIAGNNNIELLDFSAISNGSQNITSPLVFTFNKDVTSLVTGFELLVGSVNISGTETYNLSGDGLTLSVLNFTNVDVSTAKNFILRANVPSATSTDNFIVTLASAGLNPSPGIIEPFTAFTNTVSITALGVNITQNTDTNSAIAGTTNIELLDFNALSNGTQNLVSPMAFNFSADITSVLENFEVQVGGAALGGTPVYTLSNGGQTVTVTGFNPIDVSTSKNLILYADVDGNASDASDFNVTLATAGLAASPGIVNSFTTLSNSVDITSLKVSITQNTDTNTAIAGTTNIELLDFAALSNGTQNLVSPMVFNFSADITSVLENFEVQVGGVALGGTPVYTLSNGGQTLTVTGFTPIDVSSSKNLILYADVDGNASDASDFNITLATAGLAASPGIINSFTTLSNTVDITSLKVSITQNTDTNTAIAGTTNIELLDFNALS
ncbi:MAG: hypothetical protein O9262_03025, partial [Cyclobacteriaceae bacterium]|nr:hypothetical protein [Cyclobacteriaceae bacterium]